MRPVLLWILIAAVAFGLSSLVFFNRANATSELTFYLTPLECNAAAGLGCGSRAKPVLLELERHPSIAEAWLDRPGSTVTVVWQGAESSAEQLEIVQAIFVNNSVDFEPLSSNEIPAELLNSFESRNDWYRAADVDMLSREEAKAIAQTSANELIAAGLVSDSEAEAIATDIEAHFAIELVKIRSLEQLQNDEQTFYSDILAICQRHIGAERMAALYDLATQRTGQTYSEQEADSSPSGAPEAAAAQD